MSAGEEWEFPRVGKCRTSVPLVLKFRIEFEMEKHGEKYREDPAFSLLGRTEEGEVSF